MSKRYFCTLFDRNYLYKGLALYNSLVEHCQDFILYILCMDTFTYEVLKKLDLTDCILIKLDDFEDDELKRIKPTRSVAEYCWTCTPSLPLYILKHNPEIDLISYIDADILFFSDPSPIFDEFGSNSIMIIEHRFPDHLKYLEVNGIYNVQMMTFRRDVNGLKCLQWWRERCLEWCYNRLEDGKLGDQKYLDDWPKRFTGVHVLQHIGAGVAPWNVCQYDVKENNGRIYVDDYPLIFYHFHQFKIYKMLKKRWYFFASDFIYSKDKKLPPVIYEHYIKQFEESVKKVHVIYPNFMFGVEKGILHFSRQLARKLLPTPIKNALKKIVR